MNFHSKTSLTLHILKVHRQQYWKFVYLYSSVCCCRIEQVTHAARCRRAPYKHKIPWGSVWKPAASYKTTIANINSNTHHTHHTRHTHHADTTCKYTFTHVNVHTHKHTYRNIHRYVCVWGKHAGDRTIQQKAEQAETSRNGTGRGGKGRRIYRMVRDETVQYGQNRTEENSTGYWTGDKWWQRPVGNGEMEKRRKNPETDRDAAAKSWIPL